MSGWVTLGSYLAAQARSVGVVTITGAGGRAFRGSWEVSRAVVVGGIVQLRHYQVELLEALELG